MKRFLYILSLILIASLLLGGTACALFFSSDLQTQVVKVVTKELSRSLGSEVKVGRVSYRMPISLRIEDFYIEDQQQDTLLYIHDLHARLSARALRHNEVRFTKASADGVYLNAHDRNYEFILPLLMSSSDTVTTMKALITAPNVELTNARLYIDNYHLDVKQVGLRLSQYSEDSLSIAIRRLQAQYTYIPNLNKGARPLSVKDMNTEVHLNRNSASVPYLKMQLPHSSVALESIRVSFPQALLSLEKGQDLSPFAHQITADMVLSKLSVNPKDLSMLEPSLRRINEHVELRAALHGTLDSLRLRDVELKYNKHTVLKADLFVKGLPNLNTTYVRATCRDFHINAGIVQDIISDLSRVPFSVPQQVTNLGPIHYRGQITGDMRSLVLKGAFRTAQGSIATNGQLNVKQDWSSLHFAGGLSSTSFHLGRVLDAPKVGDISFRVLTDVQSGSNSFRADAQAYIDTLQLAGYTYHNIRLMGQGSKQGAVSSFSVRDTNVVICGFLPGYADPQTMLSMNRIQAQATWASWEDLETALRIESMTLRNGSDSVRMRELTFTHNTEPDKSKVVKLTSDFFAGALTGHVKYSTLPTTIKKLFIRYIPSLFSRDQRKEILEQPSNNNIRFYLYGRELKQLQRVLRLPFRVSDYPVMKGYVSEKDNQWLLQGYIPYLMMSRKRIEDITFSTDNLANRANADFSAKSGMTQLVFHSFAMNDSCHVNMSLNNIDPQRADSAASVQGELNRTKILSKQIDFIEGNFSATASFAQYAGYPLLDLHFYPSYLQYGDSIYHISESDLTYSVADTFLTVDHFRMGTQTQFIEVNGIGSTDPRDMLSVRLGELEASYLMLFALPQQSLTVQGRLSGWANLYGLFADPALEADVRLDSAGLNGNIIGDAVAKMTLDRETYNIAIDGDVTEGNRRTAHVEGLVQPAEQKWGLEIYPDSFPASFINHWTSDYINDISGRVSGHVSVFGEGLKTWVMAQAYADSVSLTIPYTGCRYYAKDSVFMDSTSIRFPNLELHDREGNSIFFDGTITHDEMFASFTYDLYARPEHALVFDIPFKSGEMLSGHAYATGDVRISGDDYDVVMTANARPTKGSQFKFNLGYASSATENDFITFYDHHISETKSKEDDDDYNFLMPQPAAPRSQFKLALNIDVDRNLDFALVLNETTSDEIRATGEGAFTVGYDYKNDNYSMVGTYTLDQGTMGFTVANVLRKDFTIAGGSTIVWSGVPWDPTLNVTADYTTSASLKDLFGSDVSAITTSRTNIPVTTSINLTGSLEEPRIRFSLSLPRSEREIEDKVRAVINTEEMLMRQVVYLLLFSRFYTPDYMSSENTSLNASAMYTLLSNTVTTQINRWLGKLTNAFTMGINVRQDGSGADAGYEAEAKFQIQPVDRLLINGDVGYRYNDITNRPLFGDMDVEYMLTQNGKFRVKAYTHMVDKYSLRQASTIQGVGFVFKHDFNWPKHKKKK